MVLETVRRARIRIIANETIRHSAFAASAALASLIALLLAGTQILSWVWLLLLPSLTIAAGIYLTWRRAPSSYQTAQSIDRHLQLADTLSTAVFLAFDPRGAADMRRAQWAQAEQVAAGVDLQRAIPIRMPRATYAAAMLALIAASLFALRYGLDRRLNLQAPLARLVQQRLGYPETREAARDPRKPAPQEPKQQAETGVSLDDPQQKGPGELDAAPDSALDSPGVPDVDNKNQPGRSENSKMAQSAQLEGGQNQGDQPEGLSANAGTQQSGEGKPGTGAGKPGQGDEKQASANSGENSGLLGKFRDAMSSLMNRVRQQSGPKGGQQQSAAQNGQQKSQQSGAGQNGKQGQQPGDGQQADGQEGQPGDDSQNAQNAQSGSPGESGQQPATKQPGSGIGRQDGSKDVKLAEQLAAMGKISEIIGKRAASVSGEVTVEVQNSNQQLHTPYAQSAAHHLETGGEIHRDEVPVALQAYVQQYFEQVRKQAAGTAVHPRRHVPEAPKPGI
jgi:hypothetical protein